jgi:NAD(P)-dependent dehydrogenase (short-subunit alcohol dehydrogenase family)
LWCTAMKSRHSRKEADMSSKQGTVIVTGASQGIGAGVVRAFLDQGFNVVANSRNITKSGAFAESAELALVDGNIGESPVAARVVETAISRFGSIAALVNNAGIFFTKAFTDYTSEDFQALSNTNLEGFLYVTQGAVKQMLSQKSGGSVVSITTSIVVNPIAGVTASVPMITKGGLEAVTRSLASEYAKDHIRFNAVAPGVVDTPLHKNNPKEFLKSLSPMGAIADVSDIVDAVVYLTKARQVTGEVLHVDGGAHSGKW